MCSVNMCTQYGIIIQLKDEKVKTWVMEDLVVKQRWEQAAQKCDTKVLLIFIIITILNSTW